MGAGNGYWKRMWYLWYPVIIRFAISFGISLVVTGVFFSREYMKQFEEIQAMLTQGQDIRELLAGMQEQILAQVMELEVPMGIAVSVITIPVMFFFFFRDRKREKISGIVNLGREPFFKYGVVLVMAVAMCIGLNIVILLANLPQYSESYEKVTEAFYSPTLAVQIVYLGILSPVCEELVFRGLMFRRLREDRPFGYAAFYAAMVFSLMHGNLVQMLYALCMGLLFAYVYEKYGSLWAPAAAHIAANIAAVLGTEFHWFDWIFSDLVHIMGVTVICALSASVAYIYIQRLHSRIPGFGTDLTEN